MREDVAVFDISPGQRYPDPWIARGSLAACLFGLGENIEAERLVRRSLEALEMFEEFPRNPRYNILRVAGQFEVVGRPDLTTRYRALVGD